MNNSASMNNETQYQFLNTVSSDIVLVSGQPTSGSFSLMYSINPNYTSSVYFNVNSSYSAVSAVVNSNSANWDWKYNVSAGANISITTATDQHNVTYTVIGQNNTSINSAIQNTNGIMKLSINTSPSAGMTLTDTSNNVYFQHNNSGLFVNSGSSVTGNVTIQGDYYTPISNSNRWAQMILPKITGAGYTTNTMITDTYSIKCNVISGTYTSASFADNNFYFIAE